MEMVTGMGNLQLTTRAGLATTTPAMSHLVWADIESNQFVEGQGSDIGCEECGFPGPQWEPRWLAADRGCCYRDDCLTCSG